MSVYIPRATIEFVINNCRRPLALAREYMAKECAITGKSSLVAGRYSNRVRATKFNPLGKFRRKANLQTKSYYVPEIDKTLKITVSTSGMRTINKKGTYQAFKDAGIIA